MLDRMKESSGRLIGFRYDGKLSEDECVAVLIPELERAIDTHQNARLLLKIEGFRSWRPGEGWAYLKTWSGMADVDRIAIVGGERWREWMNHLPGLFVGFVDIDVRYFPEGRLRDAWGWLAWEENRTVVPRELSAVQ